MRNDQEGKKIALPSGIYIVSYKGKEEALFKREEDYDLFKAANKLLYALRSVVKGRELLIYYGDGRNPKTFEKIQKILIEFPAFPEFKNTDFDKYQQELQLISDRLIREAETLFRSLSINK